MTARGPGRRHVSAAVEANRRDSHFAVTGIRVRALPIRKTPRVTA